jgi:excinuclease UvrABC nuclease subunit
MGKKRVNKLFTHYQNIEDIAMADPERMSRRLSISKELSVQCTALAKDVLKKKKS